MVEHRSPRPRRDRADGRHLLRSRTVAAELVRDAALPSDAHVWEIGAGSGRLTEALADRVRVVTAVERDPLLAGELRRRFAHHPAVEVVCGDALVVPPPQTPYRAFGNIPFAITTALLRRLLDDPSGPLVGADLLVQLEVARKRASIAPSTLLTLGWAPWWTFALQRRIAASAFQPSPSVDAGLLVAARREPSLLHARDRAAYLDLVRRAFRRASWPVRRSLRDVVPAAAWKQLVRERGLAPDALPRDLDVFDWVALWQRAAHRVSADSTSPHQRPSSRG